MWLIFWGILKNTILAPLMAFFKFLLENPKDLAVFLVVIVIGFSALRLNHYINGLKHQVDVVTQERDVAIKDRDYLKTEVATLQQDIVNAKQVNDENQQMIDQLQIDQSEATKVIHDLKRKADDNKKRLSDLAEKLKTAQDGPVADVLREAVEGIQLNRDIREKDLTP